MEYCGGDVSTIGIDALLSALAEGQKIGLYSLSDFLPYFLKCHFMCPDRPPHLLFNVFVHIIEVAHEVASIGADNNTFLICHPLHFPFFEIR